MEFQKILKEQNINTFEEVKNLVSNEPYNLKVKEDGNLYMITYNHNDDNLSPLVKQCRGLILEKDTNKIVCYSFNKMCENVDELDKNTIKVEDSIDGTQIRLFFYNGEWRYSTTRCIDAKKAYWISKKSFYEMFMEAVGDKLDYETLNKNYCYAFVLAHPENRIVVHYPAPFVVHLTSRNLETLKEEDVYIGITKARIHDYNTLDDVYKWLEEANYVYEGFVLCDENYNRYKLRTETYKKMLKLRGNTNNFLFRYFELKYENLVDFYLSFYPELYPQFSLYELDLRKIARKIHKYYVDKHVHGLNIELPGHLRKFIYKLHGKFLETRQVTNNEVVYNELIMLHPKQLYFIYNRT